MEQTLWQHWTQKKTSEKDYLESKAVYNELNLKANQILSFNVLDYRGKDFTVNGIEEHLQKIGNEEFKLTTYLFDEEDIILKVCCKKCWLLKLYDSFAFNEDFLNTVEDALTSNFNLDDIGAEFNPINKSKSVIHIITDISKDKAIIHQWVFSRIAKDEASQEFTEMLFVEQDQENGWFQLWLGSEIPLDRIVII
jgi:hypothetical protein